MSEKNYELLLTSIPEHTVELDIKMKYLDGDKVVTESEHYNFADVKKALLCTKEFLSDICCECDYCDVDDDYEDEYEYEEELDDEEIRILREIIEIFRGCMKD